MFPIGKISEISQKEYQLIYLVIVAQVRIQAKVKVIQRKKNNEAVAEIVHVDRNDDLDFIPMATVNVSTDPPIIEISASSKTNKANHHWQLPCLTSTSGNFANVTIHPPLPSSEEIPPSLLTNEFTSEFPADLFSSHKLPVYAEPNRKDL